MNQLRDDPRKPSRVIDHGDAILVPQKLTVWGWIVSRFTHVPLIPRVVYAGRSMKYAQGGKL